MTKDVTLADLKEHLEEHLEEVRQGTTLRLVEAGGRPVAEMRPMLSTQSGLTYTEPTASLKDLILPPPLETNSDPVALLREDRDSR
jgi:antitoxin (DNA-binding transcriptional repressor) of toxin-antitoxin stability system